MKRPIQPYCPTRWDYQKDYRDELIYRKTFVHEDVDKQCLEDNYFNEEGLGKQNIHDLGYDNEIIDLSSFLSQLPVIYDSSRIKIYLRRPRMMDYFQIEIINEVPIDKKKQADEYKTALKKYEKELQTYKEKKKKYDEWERLQKIKQHKKEIKRLENE